jgi:hypothetical protein
MKKITGNRKMRRKGIITTASANKIGWHYFFMYEENPFYAKFKNIPWQKSGPQKSGGRTGI